MTDVYRTRNGKRQKRGKKLPATLEKFDIDEISLVPAGSQDAQPTVLAKAGKPVAATVVNQLPGTWADGRTVTTSGFVVSPPSTNAPIAKRAALTSENDGHTHLINLDFGSGELTHGTTSWVDDHVHPWVMGEDGQIIIGEARGDEGVAHSHTIDTMSKSKETGMEDDATTAGTEETTDLEKATTERDTAVATADRLQKIVDLSAEHRAHYDTLAKEAQDEFLALDDAGRAKELQKATDANPVVHTSPDGTEYRKNDDPRLVKIAKERDEERETLAKERAELRKERMEKRAEKELPHMAGSVQVRAALLAKVDEIEDEDVRKAAMASLKAKDRQIAALMERHGHAEDAVHGDDTPMGKIQALTKARMEKHDETEAVAMDKVLQTAEGRDLHREYTESLNGAAT